MNAQGPRRTFARVSHAIDQHFSTPQCILVPSLPQVKGEPYLADVLHVKENWTHPTGQPTYVAPRSSSDARVPSVGALDGERNSLCSQSASVSLERRPFSCLFLLGPMSVGSVPLPTRRTLKLCCSHLTRRL